MAENPFNHARKFCNESGVKLNIIKGYMRHLPFKSATFSFAYSFNAIFFMKEKDIAISIREIERVLKPSGLCFVNFVSVDEPDKGAFLQTFSWEPKVLTT